ncbi:MAG TPA: ABC transporter permease [Candidatus Salinicoccus stercoripullorum]|uniref:ABC transporter permease n=1 Tax=Candidatus Salinicoccus stercoripullorum TaxID=2838756 RepID=A0A9D1U022_9STAP|nr:ABC transporter permease [Candidatus Salinicoccus stercoripullorum]
MGRIFSLIWNEVSKIFIQKSTWIMYIFLALLVVAVAVITATTDMAGKEYGADWQEELEAENEQLAEEMQEEEFLTEVNTQEIEMNRYHIDNDIKPVPYDAWQFVIDNAMLSSVISLLTIIVAGGIVANEFRWGTIKQLLIRPIPRSMILLSKYIAVLIFAMITLVFLLVLSWLTGALVFGVAGSNPELAIRSHEGIVSVSAIGEVVGGYGFKLVNLFMMATFAFMISSIFRNSALAIGTAVFLMMAGTSIVQFFADKSWSKYILFANTDLTVYDSLLGPVREEMTMGFSIVVLAVYWIVFIVAAWLFFTKRDVAGQ